MGNKKKSGGNIPQALQRNCKQESLPVKKVISIYKMPLPVRRFLKGLNFMDEQFLKYHRVLSFKRAISYMAQFCSIPKEELRSYFFELERKGWIKIMKRRIFILKDFQDEL